MNSNYGKGSSGSLNNFNFDLGLGSSKPGSLNDQKNQSSSYYSSSPHSTSQAKPTWQPNKPSWTHQPAPTQTSRSEIASGPTSMTGDIFGKTWVSSSGSDSGIGIVNKDPNLFGDLVSSAIGKPSGNVPLKNATRTSGSSNKSPYSMGNLVDSLPKTGNSAKSGGNWGSSRNSGGSSGGYTSPMVSNVNVNVGVNNNTNKSANLGGPSIKNMASVGGTGIGSSSSKDPFISLVDFGSKSSGSLNSGSKTGKTNTGNDDIFKDFQNASKPNMANTFQSGGLNSNRNNVRGSDTKMDDFGDFQNAPKSSPFEAGGFSSNGNGYSGSNASTDFFGASSKDSSSLTQPPASDDPLGMFFSASSASAVTPEVDDWGLGGEFGGEGAADSSGGSTTELDGLSPPPAGVTASVAKGKGIDNQKQGQYADAIKWLSWAEILMEKTDDKAGTMEVLSCRASCYKEVGEYKKAVADCTKVLERDEANVAVLVQRALLYESMEKYKLGAEDLRAVLKIDPGNRIARSTVHRLTKMMD